MKNDYLTLLYIVQQILTFGFEKMRDPGPVQSPDAARTPDSPNQKLLLVIIFQNPSLATTN
jgi:hypothetical protein